MRFSFGRNWQAFRQEVLRREPERLGEAVQGLRALLGSTSLAGRSFLDIGCGSGLMSLAARELGAARVVGFDYDPDSVACSRALRDERAPAAGDAWEVHQGSVLDEGFVRGLGAFDVVYSWGVLHHTGEMWRAIRNATLPVAPGGTLVLAIYNRVAGAPGALSSESWAKIKQAYNRGGDLRHGAMVGAFFLWRAGVAVSQRRHPLHEMRGYRQWRGMNWLHDAHDWLGGFPYEYATVAEVERCVAAEGFRTTRVVPTDGWGNNEFVFESTRGAER